MDESFDCKFDEASEIPLWEETMRRLSSLSSVEAYADEVQRTVDITRTIVSPSKTYCDNLNSEGNSPASSLDDCEKRPIPQFKLKTNDTNNNNKCDLNSLQCSYLSEITSKELFGSNNSEKMHSRQPRYIGGLASCVKCSVNLGQKIDAKNLDSNNRCIECTSNDARNRTRPCSVVLHNIFNSPDLKTQNIVRRFLRTTRKLERRTKGRKSRNGKSKSEAKQQSKPKDVDRKPKLSTSRWLNIWKEGDCQLNAELNYIHVTRNTVRSLQQIVHHDM